MGSEEPMLETVPATDDRVLLNRSRAVVTELADFAETGTGALRLDLARRLVAEALGTALLIIAVIGSGIMASRLSPDDVGLQLLENAAATAGALIGLILMFGAVSGAHFNPVVTLVDRMFGTITTTRRGPVRVAQIVGGCVGAVIANIMFELARSTCRPSPDRRARCGCPRSSPPSGCCSSSTAASAPAAPTAVPFAVGVWIGGAYWFTSSTSFANPAVTIARTLSDSFAGIKPSSAPMFIVMQLIGAVLAFVLIRFLYPAPDRGHADA